MYFSYQIINAMMIFFMLKAAIDLDKDVIPEDSGPIECKVNRFIIFLIHM